MIFKNILSFLKNNYFKILIILVVILAFILRYWHTKIGLPYLYYFDEPQTASTALKIMKTGDYNPHFFNYGSMMIYSNLIVDILHYLYLIGQPDSHLTTLNDIKINADTSWHWTISHPSFYHWNRVLTAVLGTGTVFVTYLLGKYIFNKWIGLIAAIFLAILPFHIEQSAIITNDVPVTFFVLCIVLFSTMFIKFKKKSYFIISLIFVGVAISTKYNSAISLVIPLLSLLIVYVKDKSYIKGYMWFLVPLIPTIIFLIIVPYSFLDLTTFLKDVGYEVRHYKLLGHFGATSKPGWEHFIFQIKQFYNNIGLANTILIVLGFLGIFIRPLFIFVLILPIIYIKYMTGMIVNFHRNFVQIYPFLSLLFAAGVYTFYKILITVQNKKYKKYIFDPILVTTFLVFVYLIPQLLNSIITSKKVYKQLDSRTESINIINKLKDIKLVIFSKELKVKQEDLKRLKVPYWRKLTYKIKDSTIVNDSNSSAKGIVYVIPQKLGVSENNKNENKNFGLINNYLLNIDKKNIIKTLGNGMTNARNGLTVNPKIMILKSLPVPQIKAKKININPIYNVKLDKCIKSMPYRGNPLKMLWQGYIRTPFYIFEKGNYSLKINAKGTKAFNEYSKLKLQILAINNHKKEMIVSKIITLSDKFKDYILPFDILSRKKISIAIRFINDASNGKDDRNVFLKSIIIKKSQN